MSSRNTVLRAVDQVSLAAWFGGSLMGALALPRAARASDQPLQAEGAGWQAWQPVQTAAVVAQLASGAALTYTNKSRVLTQRGVLGTSAGVGRDYSGPFGKSDRALALGVIAVLVAMGLIPVAISAFVFPTLAVLSIVTVVNRVRAGLGLHS